MVQLRDIIPLHVACIAKMRRPGIEPGAYGWEPYMLPLHQRRLQSLELAYRSPHENNTISHDTWNFKIWRIGVSIPVPRACKARTLPIELIPLTSDLCYFYTDMTRGRLLTKSGESGL